MGMRVHKSSHPRPKSKRLKKQIAKRKKNAKAHLVHKLSSQELKKSASKI